MVIGFEQMQPGSIKSAWSDRPSPMGKLRLYEVHATHILTSHPYLCRALNAYDGRYTRY